MMLRKLLANKKIIIVGIAILLALIVGIVILVTPKEEGGKNSGTKTEQGKEDADFKDNQEQTGKEDADSKDNQENDSEGLEVLEPNELAPEDSSDASGSWDNVSGSNTQTDNTGKIDNTEQTENKDPNVDKEVEGKEPEKAEDILEDDISWGDVY